jgi:hypothetical protein
MNAVHDIPDIRDIPEFALSVPRYLLLIFAASLVVNASATLLLAAALVLHIGGRL